MKTLKTYEKFFEHNILEVDWFIAIKMGRLSDLRKYLKEGYDINTKHSHLHISGLLYAIGENKKNIALFLIKNGADVNIDNESPLMRSIGKNYYDLFLKILEIDKNINYIDSVNDNALMWAIGINRYKYVVKLLEKNINTYQVNLWQETPLILAAKEQNMQTIKLLLDKSDLNFRDSSGNTFYDILNERNKKFFRNNLPEYYEKYLREVSASNFNI